MAELQALLITNVNSRDKAEEALAVIVGKLAEVEPSLAGCSKVVDGKLYVPLKSVLVPSHNPDAETPITCGEYLRLREGKGKYIFVRVEGLYQAVLGGDVQLECREYVAEADVARDLLPEGDVFSQGVVETQTVKLFAVPSVTKPTNVFYNIEEYDTQLRGLLGHGSSCHYLCRYVFEGEAKDLRSSAPDAAPGAKPLLRWAAEFPDRINESKRWNTGLAPQAYLTSYDVHISAAARITKELYCRMSSSKEKDVVITLTHFAREAFAAVMEASHYPKKHRTNREGGILGSVTVAPEEFKTLQQTVFAPGGWPSFPYKAATLEDIPGDPTQDIMIVDGSLTFEFTDSWQCPSLKIYTSFSINKASHITGPDMESWRKTALRAAQDAKVAEATGAKVRQLLREAAKQHSLAQQLARQQEVAKQQEAEKKRKLQADQDRATRLEKRQRLEAGAEPSSSTQQHEQQRRQQQQQQQQQQRQQQQQQRQQQQQQQQRQQQQQQQRQQQRQQQQQQQQQQQGQQQQRQQQRRQQQQQQQQQQRQQQQQQWQQQQQQQQQRQALQLQERKHSASQRELQEVTQQQGQQQVAQSQGQVTLQQEQEQPEQHQERVGVLQQQDAAAVSAGDKQTPMPPRPQSVPQQQRQQRQMQQQQQQQRWHQPQQRHKQEREQAQELPEHQLHAQVQRGQAQRCQTAAQQDQLAVVGAAKVHRAAAAWEVMRFEPPPPRQDWACQKQELDRRQKAREKTVQNFLKSINVQAPKSSRGKPQKQAHQ